MNKRGGLNECKNVSIQQSNISIGTLAHFYIVTFFNFPKRHYPFQVHWV